MTEAIGMVLASGLAILFIDPIHRLLWWISDRCGRRS